jgi:hypothetical protein
MKSVITAFVVLAGLVASSGTAKQSRRMKVKIVSIVPLHAAVRAVLDEFRIRA